MTGLSSSAAGGAGVRPGRVPLAVTGLGGLLFGLSLGCALAAVLATRLFGFSVLAVASGSMEPALSPGDVIVVRPASTAQIDVGDIVLFESGGDGVPTVHRVVGKNEVVTQVTSRSTGETQTFTDYRLLTRGDANPAPDPGEVDESRLRGEVWFGFPNPLAAAGIPLQAGLFGVAAVVGAVWAAWEVLARVRSRADAAYTT